MTDKVKKLFEKISLKERNLLDSLLQDLIAGKKGNLNIVKIINSDLYRLKKSHFRIIFHYENGEIVVDSIKMRNEKTYKKLP
jgi:mRNA-degrading endonuclease RelE of RelBE toxin-antitoxin system